MPDSRPGARTTVQFDLPVELAQQLAAAADQSVLSSSGIVQRALSRWLAAEKERNAVYLSAAVLALVEGLYEQNTSLAEIKLHGDFGLGTFNDLDGEMVLLDGVVYQLKADGEAYSVDDSAQTPFACVTFFNPLGWEQVEGDFDFDTLNHMLAECTPSLNMLHAIRIDGRFKHVRTRSVPKQQNYRPLVEVARDQPTFDYYDVEGTMTGFYTPEFMSSLNVPGYHLHFLSADLNSKAGQTHKQHPCQHVLHRSMSLN